MANEATLSIVGRMSGGKAVAQIADPQTIASGGHFGVYAQKLTQSEAEHLLSAIDTSKAPDTKSIKTGIRIPMANLKPKARTLEFITGLPNDALVTYRAELTTEFLKLPVATDIIQAAGNPKYQRKSDIAAQLGTIDGVLLDRGIIDMNGNIVPPGPIDRSTQFSPDASVISPIGTPPIWATDAEVEAARAQPTFESKVNAFIALGMADDDILFETLDRQLYGQWNQARFGMIPVSDEHEAEIEKRAEELLAPNRQKIEAIRAGKTIEEPLKIATPRVYGFQGEHRFGSNMYPWAQVNGKWTTVGPPAPITFDGIEYPTSEHAYVAQKTTNLADRHRIASISSAPAVKKEGQKLKIRPDWDAVKNSLMLDILRMKFQTHPDLAEKLINTKDAELIEANYWNDRYWGVDAKSGIGQNRLGIMLMQVRGELMEQQKSKTIDPLVRLVTSISDLPPADHHNEAELIFSVTGLSEETKARAFAALKEHDDQAVDYPDIFDSNSGSIVINDEPEMRNAAKAVAAAGVDVEYRIYVAKSLEGQPHTIVLNLPAEQQQEIAIAQKPQDAPTLPKKTQELIYTGIGSRDTPPEVQAQMTAIAARLQRVGFTLRSGAANGADSAFERGVSDPKLKQIFLPYNGFTGGRFSAGHTGPHKRYDSEPGVHLAPKGMEETAEWLVSQVHPNWPAVLKASAEGRDFGRIAHVRNAFQVYGADLNTPASFLICWAPIDGNSIKGGTRTAFELATKAGIPTYNLANREQTLALKAKIEEIERIHEIEKDPHSFASRVNAISADRASIAELLGPTPIPQPMRGLTITPKTTRTAVTTMELFPTEPAAILPTTTTPAPARATAAEMFPTTGNTEQPVLKPTELQTPVTQPISRVTAAEMFPTEVLPIEHKNTVDTNITDKKQDTDSEKGAEKRNVTILFAHASRPVPTGSSPIIYVGRSPWVPEKFQGSIWERDLGNNFVVGRDGPAGECAAKFGVQLTERLAEKHEKTRAAMNRIAKIALDKGSVTLVCHCHGVNACHSHEIGKTLATALEKLGHKADLPQLRNRENKVTKTHSSQKSTDNPEVLAPPKTSPKSSSDINPDREF